MLNTKCIKPWHNTSINLNQTYTQTQSLNHCQTIKTQIIKIRFLVSTDHWSINRSMDQLTYPRTMMDQKYVKYAVDKTRAQCYNIENIKRSTIDPQTQSLNHCHETLKTQIIKMKSFWLTDPSIDPWINLRIPESLLHNQQTRYFINSGCQ